MTGPREETQKRLNTAKELLRKTCKSVTEIAKESGFTSQSTMADIFKRHYGIAPTTYRLKNGTPTTKRSVPIPTKKPQKKTITMLGIAMARVIDDNVSETVARYAGYKSGTALCTQFKRVTDFNITEFRESNPFIKVRNDMLGTRKTLMDIAVKRGFGTDEILKIAFETHSQKAGELGIEAYREHLKIWRAERLLRRTDLDEKFIVDSLGFTEVKNFRASFKLRKGNSPLNYRHANNSIKALKQMYAYA